MLTDFQKKKLTHFFNFWDADNNGYLEKNDYEQIANRIAEERGWVKGSTDYAATYNAVMATWNEAKQFADKNKDNRITLSEWLAYYDYVITNPATYRMNVVGLMTAILNAIDADNDGLITPIDFQMLFRMYSADENTALVAFNKIDNDRSGAISVDELFGAVDTFFLSDDPLEAGNYLFGMLPSDL